MEPSDDEELIAHLGADAPSYNSESFNSESYNSESYIAESYNSESYNSESYNSESYNSESYNSESLTPAAAVPAYNHKLIYDNEEIVIVKTDTDIDQECRSTLLHNGIENGMEYNERDVDSFEPDIKDIAYRKIQDLFPNEDHEMTSEVASFYDSKPVVHDVCEKMEDLNGGEEIIVVKPDCDIGFENFYLSRHNEADVISVGEVDCVHDSFGRRGGGVETKDSDSLLSKCISRISKRKQLSVEDPKKIDLFERCLNDTEPKLYNGDEEIVIVHAEPDVCDIFVPQEDVVTDVAADSLVANNELEEKESAVR